MVPGLRARHCGTGQHRACDAALGLIVDIGHFYFARYFILNIVFLAILLLEVVVMDPMALEVMH